ncbi:MAG TPA: ABC transporter permease subunit [Mycobacteriales bacterium]|nr:ABC transporter permease subunit [Mycobacteriales bacterium]
MTALTGPELGFGRLLHAEWTKFRTVRGWVIGMVAAALVTVLLGLIAPLGGQRECVGPHGTTCAKPTQPVGPDGEAVTDGVYFVHQPLGRDGAITVRVASLTGQIPPLDDPRPGAAMKPGLVPWAKAGLLVRASTRQGSPYAAVMTTGHHGVRMQYDYTHDAAGTLTGSTGWLRLVRSGDTLTGYESSDGRHWKKIGTAHLAGLPATVPAGLFVASPAYEVTTQSFGGTSTDGGASEATAAFDHLSLQGGRSGGTWHGAQIGSGGGGPQTPGFQQSNGTFHLTGSGDIAPAVAGPEGDDVEGSLIGAFAGLLVVIVVATLFITAEYRRGLIRTSLAADPRRGVLLLSKAVVLGAVTFVAGLAAAAIAFFVVRAIRHSKGDLVLPVTWSTELRVIAGTAALLAVAAVLALALGTLLRRSAAAVATGIVLIVLPYILAVASVLPVSPAQWVLRISPAAAFAIQQSIPQYAQVDAAYTPSTGYFPLSPWAGFAVLCGWTALALGFAIVTLRRRDA